LKVASNTINKNQTNHYQVKSSSSSSSYTFIILHYISGCSRQQSM
jgi:hypothetical protein